jgi:hypothetical protein
MDQYREQFLRLAIGEIEEAISAIPETKERLYLISLAAKRLLMVLSHEADEARQQKLAKVEAELDNLICQYQEDCISTSEIIS